MKYGEVICDPNSEEAKALVGKKIIGGWDFAALKNNPENYLPAILYHIDKSSTPFVVDGASFYFIREVIKEESTYRPYKDTTEMVEDFKTRFMHKDVHPAFKPLIWMTFENGPEEMVTAFGKTTVWINGGDAIRLDYLYGNYTYLDGSPIGKEER